MYFSSRYYGSRYWGVRYWGGGTAPVVPAVAGRYFGARYWGGRHYGARYWGTQVVAVVPTVAPTFLVALMQYLTSHPDIAALVEGRAYFDMAPENATYPMLVVEDYSMNEEGVSNDTFSAAASLVIHATSYEDAYTVWKAVRNAVDPPALNPNSTRTGRMAWARGEEITAERGASRPDEYVGQGPHGEDVWFLSTDYVFWLHRDLEPTAPVAPVAYDAPDPLPPSFVHALAHYMASVPALVTVLGGARVYLESPPADDPDAVLPYIIIRDYVEDAEGESGDTEPVNVLVIAMASDALSADTLHTVICDSLDPPSLNPYSSRVHRLAWQGGVEQTAMRGEDRMGYLPGVTSGGNLIWAYPATYEFWVDRSQ